jgi:hypothetical protein
MVIDPTRRSLRIERRRIALSIPSSVYRSLLAISRCVSAAFAGMRTGEWRDVAVDAKMQLGIEPSSAVKIVIGTITVTLRTLRQCGRRCAQQQRHCHDEFRCTHGSISSRSRSTASQDCYRLMELFIRSEQSQDFVQSVRQDGFSRRRFSLSAVDAAPTVLLDALKKIETGVRNYAMAGAFDCLGARRPAAFAVTSSTFAQCAFL